MRRLLLTVSAVTLLALLAVAAVSGPAEAGCGYYPSYSYPSYSYPSYSYPSYSYPSYSYPSYSYYSPPCYQTTQVVTQPVIVPATVFQFLPAYGAGVQTSYGTQLAPVAAQGGVPTQGSVSVQAGMSTQGGVSAQVGTAAQAAPQPLPAQAPAVAAAGQGGTDLPVAQVADARPQAGAGQAQQADQGPADAAGAPADVVQVLSNRCSKCHTGASAEGKGQPFVIFSAGNALAQLTPLQKARVALRARRATMPPAAKGDPNSPAACTGPECDALDAWAEEQ